MKETLDEESKEALIAYRIQRAYETLKEAEVMIRESFYNAAINRMYYACYYAAIALLLKYNIQPQTHNGVKTMLGLHFISNGKLSIKVGKTFTTLFEKRHSGDYDDFVYCDREMVTELYPQSETFIDAINELLKKK
ncbi:HEPN domain-containing protein [Phocaeicola sp.]